MASAYQCYNCGNKAQHAHHVIPKIVTSRLFIPESRTVPLCHKCHGHVHNLDFNSHSKLTKAGMRKARSEGKHIGRPSKVVSVKKIKLILKLHKKGESYTSIGKLVKLSRWVVTRVVNENS